MTFTAPISFAQHAEPQIDLDERAAGRFTSESPSVVIEPPRFARGVVYGLALSVILLGLLAVIAFGAYSIVS